MSSALRAWVSCGARQRYKVLPAVDSPQVLKRGISFPMMTTAPSQPSIKCNDFQDNDQMINYYDEWAKEYDKDTRTERGYIGPQMGANTLVKFLEQHQFGTDCRILDVGSGTGLVAEGLKKSNYTNVDALEPSEKSNEVARSKGLYKNFFAELILPGKQLPISPNTYDALISVGVFTKNNLKAYGMDEMVRMVRPGGLICFSIREDVIFDKEYGYEEKMALLLEEKAWKLLSKSLEPYHERGDMMKCHMFVYQVL